MVDIRRDAIRVAEMPNGLLASDAMYEAHERLLWQLNPNGPKPEVINLQAILYDSSRELVVATIGDAPETHDDWRSLAPEQFIGTLTLIEIGSLTRNTGKIEHVVVDNQVRNLGIGKKLVGKAFELADKRELTRLELTSNSTRIEAQRLYASTGFETRDTVNWRYQK